MEFVKFSKLCQKVLMYNTLKEKYYDTYYVIIEKYLKNNIIFYSTRDLSLYEEDVRKENIQSVIDFVSFLKKNDFIGENYEILNKNILNFYKCIDLLNQEQEKHENQAQKNENNDFFLEESLLV